jgi:stage V sporulation protein D (sporulation-specific penicillin-binding protein)
VRLFWVQVVDGAALARTAQEIHLHTVPLPARRGEIVDRNGTVLAISGPAYSVYADPRQVTDPAAETARLAPLLALPRQLVEKRLSLPGRFAWVYRGVSQQQAQAIRALHLPGIGLQATSARHYPQGMLLGQVLGFVGLDGNGLDGLELSYNRELAGSSGFIEERFDGQGNPLPGTRVVERRPQPGPTLRLNIDSGVQFTLQQDLDAEVALSRARAAWGIVMDPSTGAVLGMSAWPTFDPNHFESASPRLWTNPVVSDTFVPGSIFKVLTAGIALGDGVVSPHTPFDDPGVLVVDGVPLHDFQRLASRTDVTRAFEESANVVYGQVGLMVGRRRFYQGLRSFGLFGPTGVDLPGESPEPDIITPEAQATPLALAEMSFGESLAVTPLSLMMALNAVANGGTLVAPRLAQSLVAADGRVVRRFPVRTLGRALAASAAAEVRAMMVDVVRYGTGQRGFIPCYDVGGKTGTANIYRAGRTTNSYYASFYAFAPADRPRVAALVTIVDPQGPMNEGGEVAAPVVQAVLRAALHDLGVAPHCTAQNATPPAPGSPGATRLVLDMVSMPDLVGLTPGEAATAARKAGVVASVRGTGGLVLRQNPPPGAMVQKYTTVEAYTAADALEPGTLVAVPALRGMTLEEAALALSRVGLNLDAVGVGTVRQQSPAAGRRVPVGTGVTATLAQGG